MTYEKLRLLDSNVLVHAAYRRSAMHAAAAELLDRALRYRGFYCIAPQNLIEFAAVITRQRHVEELMPVEEVARMANLLFRSRSLTKIYPRRATVLRAADQGARLGISGTAWYDLFLAMTMRDSKVEVVVTENVGDFRKFPFVKPVSIPQALEEVRQLKR